MEHLSLKSLQPIETLEARQRATQTQIRESNTLRGGLAGIDRAKLLGNLDTQTLTVEWWGEKNTSYLLRVTAGGRRVDFTMEELPASIKLPMARMVYHEIRRGGSPKTLRTNAQVTRERVAKMFHLDVHLFSNVGGLT